MEQRKKTFHKALGNQSFAAQMEVRFYKIVEETNPDIPEYPNVKKITPYLKEISREFNTSLKEVESHFFCFYLGLLAMKSAYKEKISEMFHR